MKSLKFLAFSLFAWSNITNAQSDARISTAPENVLVYLNGAQIQSKGKASLK